MTSILDDFSFYETRQKLMQEKRTNQRQFQKKAQSDSIYCDCYFLYWFRGFHFASKMTTIEPMCYMLSWFQNIQFTDKYYFLITSFHPVAAIPLSPSFKSFQVNFEILIAYVHMIFYLRRLKVNLQALMRTIRIQPMGNSDCRIHWNLLWFWRKNLLRLGLHMLNKCHLKRNEINAVAVAATGT